ncbi:MAG: transporter, ATPase subunit [Fibrobacteres bacterium]|nr:transporter, ATPase subunit [Fibrobacterota bacterium]
MAADLELAGGSLKIYVRPPMQVLSVQSLAKRYGSTEAVRDISFHVGPNEIVGLLGPNGAGKTTTINMILGVLEPTSGAIHIEGLDLAARRTQALSRTNFAAVYAPLPGNLTVYHNLRIFGLIYGVEGLRDRIEELLIHFDLVGFRNAKCGVLSSGEQTRVALAKAMLNKPRLLLLDEPTASLDPAMASDIRRHIRAFADEGKGGVLWTSHNMYEVEEVCDRVLFLSRGRILLEGDPKALAGKYGKRSLEELFIAVARDTGLSENGADGILGAGGAEDAEPAA